MAINSVAYDFENIRIDLGGTETIGLRSISYEDGFENEKMMGARRWAEDSTEGVYNAEDAEAELLFYEYRNLISRLGNGFGNKSKRFDISVTYAHDGEPTVTDILQGCRIRTPAADHSQGGDNLVVSVTFEVMRVKWDGNYLLDDG